MARKARSLQELSIRNIGVIDQAQISFGPGFNVITGETGAGKTMVLTGLGLLSGMRSDVDLIRAGADRLSVTLTATLESDPKGSLADLIEEHQPEIEDATLLLQRSITIEGKSKAVVGSDPVTVSVLSQFTSELLAIHGQGSTHRIADSGYQLQLLDRTSGEITDALAAYQESRSEFKAKSRELSEVLEAFKDKEREVASLERFLGDVDRIHPLPGEWDELEDRIRRLDSVEDLRIALTGALSALDNEEHGAIGLISEASKSLATYRDPDTSLREIASRIRASQIELSEVVADVASELSSLDVEPGALDALRDRRATLRQFLQKYRDQSPEVGSDGATLDGLLATASEKRALLNTLQGDDDSLEGLRDQVSQLQITMGDRAERLSQMRRAAAERLSASVNQELRELGLGRSLFHIEVSQRDDLSDVGSDEIEFRFSAHESGKPLPIHKGASGGELSRVMLAIELALAEHREIGTLIFDEIDSGIGGETGLIIGERIARLAKHFQVIVITHLAQVAVWADRHYRIEKSNGEDTVVSTVEEIRGESRVIEIARMLSGQSDLSAAQRHAMELLKHAGK